MPLLDFWKASPDVGGQLSIEQIVAMSGDGMLAEGRVGLSPA
jgi:hypothetical protein